MRHLRASPALAVALLLLSGCGTFTLPNVYLLGDPRPEASGVSDEARMPHLELKTVSVPDYLDSTDIVRRKAPNEVVTSDKGRWGERLSIGVTHALAGDLARRLPNVVIENRGVYEPSRRLLVDVERFDVGEDGVCTLTARWRLTGADGKVPAASEEGTFVQTATSPSDASVALAMTAAIGQLAGQIAITIQRSLPTGPAETPGRAAISAHPVASGP